MTASAVRIVFTGAGLLSLALALLGVVLPLLPTTPLVLLAAFFFSKASPRLHAWLLRNRLLGPMIADWQRNGVIRPRAKLAATVVMTLLCGYTTGWVPIAPVLKMVVLGVCGSVLLYIWSRPSHPPLREQPARGSG